ncbi:MAG TPA: hypothetical protein VGL75_04240 [Acidothermaceae bacterium]|jgi:hypothetical protein
MPDFDKVADELYGLPPEEFTAARTRYEKEAKAAGDRDAAARIHGLGKATVTAWLANQLVRSHRSELEPLLELGAALRDATSNLDGDQLRELSRQQQKVMYALVQQARALARAAGRTVSEDAARALEDTLRAALADELAARFLLLGRLTDALHSSDFGTGFGSEFGTATADVIPIGRRAGTPHSQLDRPQRAPRDEQQQLAEHALVEAGRVLAAATSALTDAQARVSAADEAAASAHARVGELRQQLAEASTSASDADHHRRDLTGELERAERAVRNAERKHVEAQERRDRIAKDD